ncbi:hypothetical protein RBU60_10385 [Mesonia sp. MT50]|uniref:Uncharacterized protein n=1 Tax=Mesonia profundi TaxID=3070998 RepID=A0ABU1A2Y1_9FLAO|nr:hypothetical protein [Mesonia profundi]MDQ7917984.1 hypothetical protein [Mesonia profundi]
MAKQVGIIRLKGTIAGISFYKSSDGYLAREKGGVDKNRINSDPAFQRTRENGSEFGRAGKGGKLIRNSIRLLLQNASDKRVTSRLTKQMVAIIKTDATNARGERTVIDGDMELLKGFNFNINGILSSTLFADYTTTIDRVTGEVNLNLDAYKPINTIKVPGGTTHFRLSIGGAELDFENEAQVFAMEQTSILPYDEVEQVASVLTATLTPNSTLPLVGVICIEFFQEVNGQMYPLKNGAFNALSVAEVDNL